MVMVIALVAGAGVGMLNGLIITRFNVAPLIATGGVLGAELGARRLGTPALRRALAVVLVIAGLKLIFLG
jgi:predicted ABC-type sugar transport system permease subunit